MSPNDQDNSADAARQNFPRGLSQPETGFRFSADSLLLAAFARRRGDYFLDLGAGSGAAAFAYLLDAPGARGVGLDMEPEMILHAEENNRRLGFGDDFRTVLGEAAQARELLPPESFDLILANPPYRDPATGRLPDDPGRLAARFEAEETLADFASAAFYALKNRKSACFVYLAERLDVLLATLAGARLTPKRLRLVHGRADLPARLVLAEARKNGRPGLSVEPPLILYAPGPGSVLTQEALAFCPHLAANADRSPHAPNHKADPS